MIALLLLVVAAGGAAAAVVVGDIEPAAVLVGAAVLAVLWLTAVELSGRAQLGPGRPVPRRVDLTRTAAAVLALALAVRTPRHPRHRK